MVIRTKMRLYFCALFVNITFCSFTLFKNDFVKFYESRMPEEKRGKKLSSVLPLLPAQFWA